MKTFIRTILIVINTIVAVSLILAYLCCFVNPETVWWIGFFGLAYIYLLTANICFAVFWLFTRKKRLALVSLILVLIGWSMIWRNVQPFDRRLPANESDRGLKVLSFNVHMFSQKDTEQPDGTKMNIFNFLRESGADIICMQEFISGNQQKEFKEENIRKKLGNTPYFHIERTTGDVGVAIFSRHKIIRKELVYTDKTTNACMCSDLLIGSDTVRVYNMHLKSIGFGKKERHLLDNAVKREYDDSDMHTFKAIIRQMTESSFRRARQVKQVSEHIAKSPYPVIICGDFNDPPSSYSYQKIRGKRTDAFVEAGKGRSTTYNIGRISSQRIDYILHSSVYKAYDYESPRVRLSDHYPVTCRLVKRQNESTTRPL